MRGRSCLFFALIWSLVYAAPTSTLLGSVSSLSSAISTRSTTPHPATPLSTFRHRTRSFPHPTIITQKAYYTPRPTQKHAFPRPQPSGQTPIAIVFEVIGGLVLVGIIISLIRCLYVYKRTPKRDRIGEIIHRHNLHQELAHLERNSVLLRGSTHFEPAPPYFPPPPSYDASSAPSMQQNGYSGLPTSSPPRSPEPTLVHPLLHHVSRSTPIPPPLLASHSVVS